MKKILLIISLLNLGYVFITMISDNRDNLFLLPFGFPLLTTTLLFMLGVVSLAFDENVKYTKTLSGFIIGINLLPILFVASFFVFL